MGDTAKPVWNEAQLAALAVEMRKAHEEKLCGDAAVLLDALLRRDAA